MLIAKNLTKRYGNENHAVNALDGVSLSVEQGEYISVMGASGSGKSTLLHILGGVDAPTSGSVIIKGIEFGKLSVSNQAKFRRRKIGLVYQFYNLIPTLTVEENIILPLWLDGKKPEKKLVNELLELLKLGNRRKHLPNQLSGGQQQRTAIGRALLAKPDILLADEPTGNLDSQNAEEVLALFGIANAEYGQTILLVTHDENVGKRAKRRIHMKDGRIVFDEGMVIA
jgi:putative ABC transport system ATP-binding protein